MGQESDVGLPSQRALASSFATMPANGGATSPAAPTNPLSAQGVPNQVYSRVQQGLRNPQDTFGSLPALAPAVANNVPATVQASQGQAQSTEGTFPSIPELAIGAGAGVAGGIALNGLYNSAEPGGQSRLTKFLDKMPGSRLGGQRYEEWLDKFRGKTEHRQLLSHQLEINDADRVVKERAYAASDKRFGTSAFSEYFKNTSQFPEQNIKDVHNTLQDIKKQHGILREGFLMRGLRSIGSKLGVCDGPIARLVDIHPDTGEVTLKAGATDAQKALIQKRLNLGEGNFDEALKASNQKAQKLHSALKGGGYQGNFSKFMRHIKGPTSFINGQHRFLYDAVGNGTSRYEAYRQLDRSLKGYNPLVRGLAKGGYYLKCAFNMESSSGGSKSLLERLGAVGKYAGPALMGAFTFGFAIKEAKKGETNKDKVKLGTREMLSGTIASLAAFELFMDGGRKIGLEKVLGRFAFKNLLGKFSIAGGVAGIGLALGASMLMTSGLNKVFDSIFGKAKTKEDAAKEKAVAGQPANGLPGMPTAAQTAASIDPTVANNATLNQLAGQLAANDPPAAASATNPAASPKAPMAATVPTTTPSNDDFTIRQSDLQNSPFMLSKPPSLADIRHNPLAATN